MEKILFTIIIPTYNRCAMLDESLRILIPQIRIYKDDVRLYISDNASTDGTKRIVEKYIQEEGNYLSYFRQPENIGGQNNFRHAVKSVNSKYVCLIGDDDVLFPNYVETIVNLLKEHPDVGLINYNVMSVKYDLGNSHLRERNMRDLYPVIYPTGKELIYNHLSVPSLISSNVFLRKKFVDKLDDITVGTYPGYDWMAALYYSILNDKCVFYGFPLLLQRCPIVQRWGIDFPWFYLYGMGKLFKELDEKIPGLYNHWIDHSHIENNNFLTGFLNTVSNNKKIYQERYETIKPYLGTKEYERKFRLYLVHSQAYADFISSPLRYLYRTLREVIKY